MLKMTSPSPAEGGWLPDRHAGYGEGRSPEFHTEGIDARAKTMVMTLDDLSHPLEPGYGEEVSHLLWHRCICFSNSQ